MDKSFQVTITVTSEEHRLLTMAFGEDINVADQCRALLLGRAASELRRMVDSANMSRRIRDGQGERRYKEGKRNEHVLRDYPDTPMAKALSFPIKDGKLQPGKVIK